MGLCLFLMSLNDKHLISLNCLFQVLFLEIGGRRHDDKLSPASQPDNLLTGLFDLGPASQVCFQFILIYF